MTMRQTMPDNRKSVTLLYQWWVNCIKYPWQPLCLPSNTHVNFSYRSFPPLTLCTNGIRAPRSVFSRSVTLHSCVELHIRWFSLLLSVNQLRKIPGYRSKGKKASLHSWKRKYLVKRSQNHIYKSRPIRYFLFIQHVMHRSF